MCSLSPGISILIVPACTSLMSWQSSRESTSGSSRAKLSRRAAFKMSLSGVPGRIDPTRPLGQDVRLGLRSTRAARSGIGARSGRGPSPACAVADQGDLDSSRGESPYRVVPELDAHRYSRSGGQEPSLYGTIVPVGSRRDVHQHCLDHALGIDELGA